MELFIKKEKLISWNDDHSIKDELSHNLAIS